MKMERIKEVCIIVPEIIVINLKISKPFHMSNKEPNVMINEIRGSIIKKVLNDELIEVK